MKDLHYGIILEQDILLRDIKQSIKESFTVHGQETNMHLVNLDGTDILVGCGRASPIVAVIVEIFSRTGIKKAFRIATSGSLQENLLEGDVVLCTAAIRGEGTTNCYISPDFPAVADFALTNRLADRLAAQNISYTLGTIWTTDGRFVETDELLKKYQKCGVLAVDMESSAFLLVSMLKGIQAATMSIVADAPWRDLGGDIKGRRSDDVYDKCILPSMRRCLKTVCSLICKEED